MKHVMARTRACRWLLAGALACALGASGAGLAHAQPAKGDRASAERRQEAELFFRAGEQAYEAGQYLVAAQAFEQAHQILPLPAILFSMAQAYRLQYFIDKEVTHLLRAIDSYRAYIQQVEQGGRRDDAATSLAELEVIRDRLQREGRLKSRRSTADLGGKTKLMVTSQVDGAIASIDGKSGEVPLILDVQPGKHRVEVEAEGYITASLQTTAVAGMVIPVEVKLEPKPALLMVQAEAGASIYIDGRPVGETPLPRPVEIPSGKHFVAVTRRGRYPWSRELDLAHGKSIEVRTSLETTGQRRISQWVFGAAALSLAAGGVGGLLTYSTDRDVAELVEKLRSVGLSDAEQKQLAALEDKRDSRLGITLACLGASAALATAGGLLYWFDTPRVSGGVSTGDVQPARDTTSSLRIAPVIHGDLAGFAVAGHF
jgi:tetratricopeptide (TPR) repeat protein